MQLNQRKFYNRTRFVFGDDDVKYTVKDKNGSVSLAVNYGALPLESSVLQEKNSWYRHIGFLWVLIGIIQMVAGFNKTGTFELSRSHS